MPWYRKAQFLVLAIALAAVSCLGWELFVNDLENIIVIKVCGYTALVALYTNVVLAIYRLVKEWKRKNEANSFE